MAMRLADGSMYPKASILVAQKGASVPVTVLCTVPGTQVSVGRTASFRCES